MQDPEEPTRQLGSGTGATRPAGADATRPLDIPAPRWPDTGAAQPPVPPAPWEQSVLPTPPAPFEQPASQVFRPGKPERRSRAKFVAVAAAAALVLALGGTGIALAVTGAIGGSGAEEQVAADTRGEASEESADPAPAAPAPAPAADRQLDFATYHHEGLGVWFDYPEVWTVEPFPSVEAAEVRGFRLHTLDCGNQEQIDVRPVRVLDEAGREMAALGMPSAYATCVGVEVPSSIQEIDRARVHLSGSAPVDFVYLTTAASAGGRYPVMGITESLYESDPQNMGYGMSFWAQSDTPSNRLPVSFASTTVFSSEENDGVGSSELPGFATEAEAEAFTGTALYRDLKRMYLSTRYQPDPEALNGDLGLAQPITFPECDGTQIAVLGTSWTPAAYREEIQRYLDAFPGSQYSRTDFLCTSFLRPALANSGDNYIYFVYRPTGDDRAATCAEVAAAASQGGNTHGKWLRNQNPGEQVPCG